MPRKSTETGCRRNGIGSAAWERPGWVVFVGGPGGGGAGEKASKLQGWKSKGTKARDD